MSGNPIHHLARQVLAQTRAAVEGAANVQPGLHLYRSISVFSNGDEVVKNTILVALNRAIGEVYPPGFASEGDFQMTATREQALLALAKTDAMIAE